MIKLIIFDWDEVITIGGTQGYINCYHKALVSVGINLSQEAERERVIAKWGKPVEEVIGELLKEKPELIAKTITKYEEVMAGDTFVDSLSIIDGALELFNHLKGKYILAIATGMNPKVLQEKVFPKFNVPNIFAQVISVYDVPKTKGKPDPYMVEKILKKQHIFPREAVLVGDGINDIKMAQNAGVIPVAVLTGHMSKADAEALGVKFILENVTRLPQVLHQLA